MAKYGNKEWRGKGHHFMYTAFGVDEAAIMQLSERINPANAATASYYLKVAFEKCPKTGLPSLRRRMA